MLRAQVEPSVFNHVLVVLLPMASVRMGTLRWDVVVNILNIGAIWHGIIILIAGLSLWVAIFGVERDTCFAVLRITLLPLVLVRKTIQRTGCRLRSC